MATSTRTQANRFFAIDTPLGTDVLLARSMTIREELGRPFHIDAELLSEDPKIKFDDIVGHPVAIRLALGTGKDRFFNGCVSQFSQEGEVAGLALYRATIVPWFWFLSRSSDCRIFQKKTPIDVIEEVFGEYSGAKFEKGLTATYEKREYQVQYRETDFNFVSRLLEQEGVAYFYEHTDKNHTMVLADNPGAYKPFPGFEKVRFDRGGSKRSDESRGISSWVMTKTVAPTKVVLQDFNPLLPSTTILANGEITRKHAMADGEIFDYPGEYEKKAEGDSYAKRRIEELQSAHEVVRGSGNCRGIACGHVFELEGQMPRDDVKGKKWLVTSATYRLRGDDYQSGGSSGGPEDAFECSFTAVESTIPFRPARSTAKPNISGPQTALVVGTSGEEITVDEHGRVKVKFHWDRQAKGDENDSCWVRVSQVIAGKGWGQFHTPRHGEEVIVEFLEGDPDRPIITGRVYNGENKPPYALPANKTMTGYKTSSSKGGAGFNELRFEDKKDSEQIFLHGQKDMDVRILNDVIQWIGHDTHQIVKNDQIETIENDRHVTIKRDLVEAIERDVNRTVKGKESVLIEKTLSVNVLKDVAEKFEENASRSVTKKYYIKAKEIVIEGEENITLVVGKTTIALDASGINLASTAITSESKGETKIDATGGFKITTSASGEISATAIKIEGKATAEMKSPMTTVKGDGMLTLKGGMTMIN